jgi:hypothetical protein
MMPKGHPKDSKMLLYSMEKQVFSANTARGIVDKALVPWYFLSERESLETLKYLQPVSPNR